MLVVYNILIIKYLSIFFRDVIYMQHSKHYLNDSSSVAQYYIWNGHHQQLPTRAFIEGVLTFGPSPAQ